MSSKPRAGAALMLPPLNDQAKQAQELTKKQQEMRDFEILMQEMKVKDDFDHVATHSKKKSPIKQGSSNNESFRSKKIDSFRTQLSSLSVSSNQAAQSTSVPSLPLISPHSSSGITPRSGSNTSTRSSSPFTHSAHVTDSISPKPVAGLSSRYKNTNTVSSIIAAAHQQVASSQSSPNTTAYDPPSLQRASSQVHSSSSQSSSSVSYSSSSLLNSPPTRAPPSTRRSRAPSAARRTQSRPTSSSRPASRTSNASRSGSRGHSRSNSRTQSRQGMGNGSNGHDESKSESVLYRLLHRQPSSISPLSVTLGTLLLVERGDSVWETARHLRDELMSIHDEHQMHELQHYGDHQRIPITFFVQQLATISSNKPPYSLAHYSAIIALISTYLLHSNTEQQYCLLYQSADIHGGSLLTYLLDYANDIFNNHMKHPLLASLTLDALTQCRGEILKLVAFFILNYKTNYEDHILKMVSSSSKSHISILDLLNRSFLFSMLSQCFLSTSMHLKSIALEIIHFIVTLTIDDIQVPSALYMSHWIQNNLLELLLQYQSEHWSDGNIQQPMCAIIVHFINKNPIAQLDPQQHEIIQKQAINNMMKVMKKNSKNLFIQTKCNEFILLLSENRENKLRMVSNHVIQSLISALAHHSAQPLYFMSTLHCLTAIVMNEILHMELMTHLKLLEILFRIIKKLYINNDMILENMLLFVRTFLTPVCHPQHLVQLINSSAIETFGFTLAMFSEQEIMMQHLLDVLLICLHSGVVDYTQVKDTRTSTLQMPSSPTLITWQHLVKTIPDFVCTLTNCLENHISKRSIVLPILELLTHACKYHTPSILEVVSNHGITLLLKTLNAYPNNFEITNQVLTLFMVMYNTKDEHITVIQQYYQRQREGALKLLNSIYHHYPHDPRSKPHNVPLAAILSHTRNASTVTDTMTIILKLDACVRIFEDIEG